SVAGRRGQERILRREPPASFSDEPARHPLLNRRSAQHLRLSLREEHRAVGLLEEVGLERERTQLVRTPSVRSAHASAAVVSWARSSCSTSAIGSCRKRAPSRRNVSGSPVVTKRYAPSRPLSFSKPLRASVSATSCAVSSAEKTSLTSRP